MGTAQGWNEAASSGVSFAGTLAAIGGAVFSGPIGAAVGAVLGLGAGMWMGGAQYNSNQDAKIEQLKLNREDNTRKRNRVIRDYKRVYSSYRTDFDTKYGKGLFDTLSMDFQSLIGITNTSALSSVIANMEYDKVSGEITSKLTGDNSLISSDDRKIFYDIKEVVQGIVNLLSNGFGINLPPLNKITLLF